MITIYTKHSKCYNTKSVVMMEGTKIAFMDHMTKEDYIIPTYEVDFMLVSDSLQDMLKKAREIELKRQLKPKTL